MSAYVFALVAVGASIATLLALRARAARRARERVEASRASAATAVQRARLESAAARRAAETKAREESLEMRAEAENELNRKGDSMVRREERMSSREAELADEWNALQKRASELDERQRAVKSLRDRANGLREDAARRRRQAREHLQQSAGESVENIKETLIQHWIEDARAGAAQRLRVLEYSGSESKYDRDAKRLMEIAVSRYQNHFLTERNISNIRVGGEVCALLQADGGTVHQVLAEVSNVQLHVNEDTESVRLEGLDGVGREIARRGLNRLCKRPSAVAEARTDPRAWATKIRDNLEREIQALGKKAFTVLKIPRSHLDIVKLVGALNYRTSYTQNQWLHAVEAAFLAGMMASEMGLDIKLARRATLMHDIGKALTHKQDGSHAVIGADIARKLGEDEVVANAIGAHHQDEPPGSVYAYLVAAADAMSGARPGARREATEGFTHRVEDLERIGTAYQGVDRAHAVHGGRELRVYVDEAQVDDMGVVQLSSEIAEQISEEMTFPGQIKITVIRAFEAVALAD
ncbi:MAG: Rnase Y domain-containing protein [Proteobacteria bacterium]|nr:Rnase Y domain-containing protein [Pseudomonadota bacterium]